MKDKEICLYILWLCNVVYKQNEIEKWKKGWIVLFPEKDELRITKNYRDISLTAIAAKVYNGLLLKPIRPNW